MKTMQDECRDAATTYVGRLTSKQLQAEADRFGCKSQIGIFDLEASLVVMLTVEKCMHIRQHLKNNFGNPA